MKLSVIPVPGQVISTVWMAEARQTEAWNHTSAILAWIGNNNAYRKKSKTFHPRDFHPYAKPTSKKPPPIKADITILKRVFVDRPGTAGSS